MSDSPYIITVTAQNFAVDVVEKSDKVPVLVDFWAEWCAPCKMLMPVLEQLVKKYQGQFILAKVNTEEEQELATQSNIRSIPTLKLFRHGQVVEEMMGVQSETVLSEIIDRHRDRPADKLRLQALALHMAGDTKKALPLLEQARDMEPTSHPIQLDLAKIMIETQQFEKAEQIFRNLPPNVQISNEVSELKAQFQFSFVAAQAPALETLKTTLAKMPDDKMTRYQLSAHQVLAGDYEGALDNLLELMRRDRKFEDDAGRKGILAVFTLLGNQGEIITRYRGKMATLLY
jgi:putative thioredoxin